MQNYLERLRRIEASGVKEAFTPSKPVATDALFCGRQKELERIVDALTIEGRQVLIFGDRGVGKTSLARHASRIYNEIKGSRLFLKQCSSEDTFETIIKDLIDQANYRQVVSQEDEKKASIGGKIVGAGIDSKEEVMVLYEPNNPSWAARRFADLNAVFIIDEFDLISNDNEKQLVAQFIKQLSDIGASLKVVIVGISQTSSDLFAGHNSIIRNLEEVPLNRMKDSELLDIIAGGEQRLGLTFDKDVKDIIIKTSGGFPYYTHLLALYSSIESIVAELKVVSMSQYEIGLAKAIESIDKSLKDDYQSAIGDRGDLSKQQFLYAVSTSRKPEINTSEVRELFHSEFGKEIDTVRVNYLRSNTKGKDGAPLISSIRNSVYSFRNPLMPIYILMKGKPAHD